ncbi:hypothetical protein [Kitasatospora cheerisanensis]|uniref:PBP domain-containing protein n=1 Tax=Kitasatospora cheerisanensis KCTC 2395 TaxID=1348663 RepID=A0A066Z0B5_9ACTN|nr:hypothetical protein [Kitasatospora cheerisanensis]KDN86957.1 hypothetical protein KCH_10420 [Kitasatospora cheerisanensis KCTC 2395]
MRVRPSGPRTGSRPWQAWLAAVLVWTLGAAAVFLPLAGPGVRPAQAASGTTVPGPARWDPLTWSSGPLGSVTVSPTSGLGNQVLHVSWSGFTPTVDADFQPVPVVLNPHGNSGFDKVARYPVRVYQCRGEQPKVTDCYGSSLYNADPAKGFLQPFPAPGTTTPEFPSNMVIAATRPDGTGEADIEVWTAQQSQTLGCDPTHKCSLVIEANYGGDSVGAYQATPGEINCEDHSADSDGLFNTASDNVVAVENTGGKRYASGEACSWGNHVVVPLSFGPTPAACAAKNADFSAIGLEMADRAVQQWRTGLCQGSNPLTVQYTSGGGEPQARAAFLRRSGGDLALTSVPDREVPTRPYVYAPLANSAISVVYLVDDGESHRQIRKLRLNQRLLAKMLTQSYRLDTGDDTDSVKGNPVCLFADPEFLRLNPSTDNGPTWPGCLAGGTFAATAPVVVGGTTDLVNRLTSWIAADPDAAQFLQGAADPWGMHLNTKYLRSSYPGFPVDAFQPQDFTGPKNWKQYEWNPVLGGLGQVLRMTLETRPSCLNPDEVAGQHAKCISQDNGKRALFAVMDTGQAQAMSLPEAELPNPAGGFTTPTIGAMQAAVNDMPLDAATGTQQLPYGNADSAYAKDAKAYPLTMVQYAMVPTEGLPQSKADAVARFLRTVTDPAQGQIYGRQPGQLAAGFAGLTNSQVAAAKAAAGHAAAQDGALPGNQTPPGSGGNGTTGPARAAGPAPTAAAATPVRAAARTSPTAPPAAPAPTRRAARAPATAPRPAVPAPRPPSAPVRSAGPPPTGPASPGCCFPSSSPPAPCC